MMVVSGPLLDNRKKKKGEVEEEDKEEPKKTKDYQDMKLVSSSAVTRALYQSGCTSSHSEKSCPSS